MSHAAPTLHMLCGKMASGKSTLAAKLAEGEDCVLISEDDWLSALYADQMQKGRDYLLCVQKFRAIIGPHVVDLLASGVSVVLDFQANTVESRAWMRDIFERSGVAHQLHVLDVSDETCLNRLRDRNAKGDHAFAPTEEQFFQFAKHFSRPDPEEGFTVVHHKDDVRT